MESAESDLSQILEFLGGSIDPEYVERVYKIKFKQDKEKTVNYLIE